MAQLLRSSQVRCKWRDLREPRRRGQRDTHLELIGANLFQNRSVQIVAAAVDKVVCCDDLCSVCSVGLLIGLIQVRNVLYTLCE